MSDENQDLLDLCRLNLMEETVEGSPAPDRALTLQAIDRKKRELVMKVKPAIITIEAMEKLCKLTEEWRSATKEYKAKVDLEPTGGKETVYLSVTFNGSTWTSIEIKDPKIEIPQIIAALENYLANFAQGGG